MLGATAIGLAVGNRLRARSDGHREPFQADPDRPARPHRPGPRVRPRPGCRSVRVPARGGRERSERHRHDVPPSANVVGTGAHRFAAPEELHRIEHPDLRVRPRQCRGRRGRRRRPGHPARALVARRVGARCGPHRERPPPLRREPQPDDRPADGPCCGAQQSRPVRGPRGRGGRSGPRARTARGVPVDPGARCHPGDGGRGAGRDVAARDVRPRPADPRLDPGPRDGAHGISASRWTSRPRRPGRRLRSRMLLGRHEDGDTTPWP